MHALICPGCGTEMKTRIDPDITTEVCPSCGGIFLDKGELNVLATGMQGDIECWSIDDAAHKDSFPERYCPKCTLQRMRKVNLLRLSDIIFDYCPDCKGFFLDKGEVEQMNQVLQRVAQKGEAEEYREYHGKHLVRVNQIADVTSVECLGISAIVDEVFLRISVFFDQEQPCPFRLWQESWPHRLLETLGLLSGQDIQTHDGKFDAAFRIQAQDEFTAGNCLTSETREALLTFCTEKGPVFSRKGSLVITPSALTYVEGSYIPVTISHVVKRSMPTIMLLTEIADRIETAQKEGSTS